jgi:predicted enzyme related to lactoylglutathione lyase
MHLRSLLISSALGCTALVPIAFGAFPELPVFQDPPTDIRYPGKLIWADLFTEKTATCKEFYTELFGWTAETLGTGEDAYTLFRKDGQPVAGMIYRPAQKGSTTKGIWLPYFSVDDLPNALEAVRRNEGRIEVASHNFPNRGEQAIVRDNQNALLGLMRTTDGDPDDYLAEYGEWIWAQLWVRDPDQSLSFYASVLGFTEMEANPTDENIYDRLWATNGVYRASLDRIPDSKPNGIPSWFGFVRVENIEETVALVSRLGGFLYLEPDPEIKEGRLAVIRDPVGATIVVLEYDPETEDPS